MITVNEARELPQIIHQAFWAMKMRGHYPIDRAIFEAQVMEILERKT